MTILDGYARARAREIRPEVRRFVIERLAEYYSPQEVARMIAREFPDEPEWTRQRVGHYGGYSGPGENLDPDLRELFEARRKAFLENLEAIPVSHRVVRLRVIQHAIDTLMPLAAPEGDAPPNFAAVDRVVTLLDLARKEMEKVGPAVAIMNAVAAGVTVNLDLPEEYRDELARRFAQRLIEETEDHG